MIDKLTACGISAFIAATTLLLIPGMDVAIRDNRVYLLGIAIILIYAVMFIRYSLYLSIFLFFLSIFMFFTGFSTMGSALYYISLFCTVLFIFIISYPFWKSRREWVYNTVCGVMIMTVATQVAQMLGANFPHGIAGFDTYGHPGLLGNVNETSCFLAVGLPFFFRRRWVWLIPIMAVGLILARTTNGFFAATLVTSLWVLIHYRKRGLLAFFVAILIMGTCFLYVTRVDLLDVSKQMGGRGKVWKATLVASTIKPFGWGFGQYEYVIPLLTHAGHMDGVKIFPFIAGVKDKKSLDNAAMKLAGTTDIDKVRDYVMNKKNGTTSVFVQAHNDYLELLFDIGYGGIVLFMGFMFMSLYMAFTKKDKTPFYSLLASSFTAIFFFSWQLIPVAVITIMSLSLSFQKEENNEYEISMGKINMDECCYDFYRDGHHTHGNTGKSGCVDNDVDLRLRPFQRARDLCKIFYNKRIG